jgi:hypothetical protein
MDAAKQPTVTTRYPVSDSHHMLRSITTFYYMTSIICYNRRGAPGIHNLVPSAQAQCSHGIMRKSESACTYQLCMSKSGTHFIPLHLYVTIANAVLLQTRGIQMPQIALHPRHQRQTNRFIVSCGDVAGRATDILVRYGLRAKKRRVHISYCVLFLLHSEQNTVRKIVWLSSLARGVPERALAFGTRHAARNGLMIQSTMWHEQSFFARVPVAAKTPAGRHQCASGQWLIVLLAFLWFAVSHAVSLPP